MSPLNDAVQPELLQDEFQGAQSEGLLHADHHRVLQEEDAVPTLAALAVAVLAIHADVVTTKGRSNAIPALAAAVVGDQEESFGHSETLSAAQYTRPAGEMDGQGLTGNAEKGQVGSWQRGSAPKSAKKQYQSEQ